MLKNIDAGLFSSFTKLAVAVLPVGSLTTDNIAALTPAQVGQLSKAQLAVTSGDQLAVLATAAILIMEILSKSNGCTYRK